MPKPLEGAAAKFAAIKFGGPVTAIDDVASVGVTQSQIFAPDADRLLVMLINMSTNLMYAGFDELVGSTRGIFLAANGGSLILLADEDLVLTTFPIHVISTGVTSNLFHLQVRRYRSSDMEALPNAS